jgi:hypothetical protein
MRAISVVTLLMGLSVVSGAALTPVRVAFLTDCTMYSDWMSLGMIYSFKMSGQPGKLTKVMCCTPEEKAKYLAGSTKALLKEVGLAMHHGEHQRRLSALNHVILWSCKMVHGNLLYPCRLRLTSPLPSPSILLPKTITQHTTSRRR